MGVRASTSGEKGGERVAGVGEEADGWEEEVTAGWEGRRKKKETYLYTMWETLTLV